MNEFVRQRHQGFETPAEILFGLVKRATGEAPIRMTKIVRGYENEVHQAVTRQARFAVKIRRFGDVGFQHETC